MVDKLSLQVATSQSGQTIQSSAAFLFVDAGVFNDILIFRAVFTLVILVNVHII